MTILPQQLLTVLASMFIAMAVSAQDLGLQVPLEQAAGGSLYVNAEAGGISAPFLVDTGAGLVTVSEALFDRLRGRGAVREVRRVAARLANNRLQALTVYEVDRFRIGEYCEIGPVELAVMPGAGRNLLGLSALGRAAPFTVSMAPPALLLSGCGEDAVASR